MSLPDRLTDYGVYLNKLLAHIDATHRTNESLAFCFHVYNAYITGTPPENEHMDKDKALAQLLESIKEVLKVHRGIGIWG